MASGRLPKAVLPDRYELELWVDLDACTFTGKLQVLVRIVENVSTVVLNVADLTVDTDSLCLRLLGESDKIIDSRSIACTVDQENELLVLDFGERVLPVAKAVLFIDYHGSLNEKLDAFYRSTYKSGGVEKNMAVTVFEPADARRCFPCWDEPEFKAHFKFKVHAPADRMVLSTMPALQEIVDGNIKVVEFQESPLMSTYITAIAIGEFEHLEGVSEDGISATVYTRFGEVEKARFGFDILLKLLPFYAKFFKMQYPLPKLDIVSVSAFKAGALEEFGLIVFKDEALFVDENTTTSKKQEVAINVAHEVGHMWFGNLVTLEWWTHIWLNEGMATWISYMAVDYLFPDWNIWMEFHKEIMYAFKLDALVSTHPVEVEVQHARETMAVFDAISYCKGAAVVYMLQDYVGLADIQRGLQLYMQRFAFGNAKSDDLWDCIHDVTGKPIKELMCSWTKQDGYPVLKATMLNDEELQIEQTRFLADGQPGEGQWIVPVKLISGSYDSQLSVLLEDKKCVVRLPEQALKLVKLNVGQSGFYRVEYDDKLRAALKESISSGLLAPIDRLGVLDDMFAFSQSTRQPLSALLSLLEAYRLEEDPGVLSHMITVALSVMDAVCAANESSRVKPQFFAGLLENAARKLGWEALEGESHLQSAVREELLHGLVVLGHEETILEAKKLFKNKATVPLAAYTLKAAYASVMSDPDRYGFDAVLNVFRTSDKLEERNMALGALAGSCNPVLVTEALNFALSPEVRPQDVTEIFYGLRMTSGMIAWNWLKENWDAVHTKLGEGFLLRTVLNRATSKLWEVNVDDVRETISSRISCFPNLAGQCCEKVKLMASWVDAIKQEECNR